MEAKQTSLIDLLERIPQGARLVVEHDQFSSSSHPVGRLCHEAAAALKAALAQQEEPVTEDMKSAVRWAPSSAYWSQRLRELFGPDAREGIDALERRLAEAQQAEPVQEQAEPVAWLQPKTVDGYSRPDLGYETCSKDDYGAFPVYRASPKAEPEQEPVAWLYEEGADSTLHWNKPPLYGTPLYTSPPKRQPQTLDEAMQQPRSMAQAYENGYKAGVAHEREACAQVCEARFMGDMTREDMEARRCAAAIRARGNT